MNNLFNAIAIALFVASRHFVKLAEPKEIIMNKSHYSNALKIGTMLFCSIVALSSAAFAADAKQASSGISADDLKKALGMSIYLQGGYTYNGAASSLLSTGLENDLRGYDHKANSFGLDLAELAFSREPGAGVIGYTMKISAGETAKMIHAMGLGTQPTGTANPESFDMTDATISYIAPIGKGLRFDIGKMVTFIGAETIEAVDSPNYSRSFLFVFAEPTTHTGVKASYVFNDSVHAALYMVNGWDNATDNNNKKSLGMSVTVASRDVFSASLNYLQGPESDNNILDNRSLIDLVATIKPVKSLSFILNYDKGKQGNGSAASVAWSGFSGIVKYDITDRYSISIRGESFDDKDGCRTGTPRKLTEVTVTPELRLAGGLIVRPEYRRDSSDKPSFDNGTKKTQNTIALSAMYRW